jgi:hypothetical protein
LFIIHSLFFSKSTVNIILIFSDYGLNQGEKVRPTDNKEYQTVSY